MIVTDFREWHQSWSKKSLAETRAIVESGKVRIVHAEQFRKITYTVGLTANYGFPEVVVAGSETVATQSKLVRKLIELVRTEGPRLLDREFLLLNRRAVLKAVGNPKNRRVASLAHTFYKGKYKLAECVFSDANGLYPWSLNDLAEEDYMWSQLCLYASHPPVGKLFKEADREFARRVRRHKDVDTDGEGLLPYPGHNKIFLTALDEAVAAAKKFGGLTCFRHDGYRHGYLGIYFELQDDEASEAALDRVESIVDRAAAMSRSVCILCGRRAKPSPRIRPHGAPVPFCDAHDASVVYTVLNYDG